jgi:hypothetical protein
MQRLLCVGRDEWNCLHRVHLLVLQSIDMIILLGRQQQEKPRLLQNRVSWSGFVGGSTFIHYYNVDADIPNFLSCVRLFKAPYLICPRKLAAAKIRHRVATGICSEGPTIMAPSMTMTTRTTNTQDQSTGHTTVDEIDLSRGYDDEQIRLMEEVCIVIDENDQPLRAGTKKECTR